MTHRNGFSLLEMLITCAIVAVLTAVGTPPLHTMLTRSQTETAARALFDSLTLARQTAIYKNCLVALQPETTWSNGWRVIVDSNRDGIFSIEDELIHVEKISAAHITAALTRNNGVVFDGNGASFTTNGSFLAGTFRICSTSANQPGKSLTIRFGGRVRAGTLNATECGQT